MKWQNSVQVFFDPYITPSNKELVIRAEALNHHYGYKSFFENDDLRSLLTPKVIIFEQENPGNTKFLNEAHNILIQLEQPNLDLFSSQQLFENAFLVKDERELENYFEMIKFLLKERLRGIELEVLRIGNEKHQKLLEIEKTKSNNLKNDSFEQLERELFEIYSVDEIMNHFNLHAQDVFGAQMKIQTLGDILVDKVNNDFLPLSEQNQMNLFLCWNKDDQSTEVVLLAFNLLKSCLGNHCIVSQSIEERIFFEKYLSQFDLPIALFDESNEILNHNRHFIDLNISSKQCLSFEHNEQITLNRDVFRVIKNTEMKPYLQIIFVPVNEFLVQSEKPSFEELGIISSSVAHELNNPLAGISAALDLLMLDDFSDETMEELEEMKKVVYRCRSLISIFLGFSQVKTMSKTSTLNNLSLESIFEQALELIRFRLIENNILLKIDFNLRHAIERDFDSSVLTMMIYLFLGELVTSFSHYNLVAGEQQKKISLKVVEDRNSFEMFFVSDVVVTEEFYNSKLVSHLFDLLNLRVSSTESGVKFSL